jgi:hypothetical protein
VVEKEDRREFEFSWSETSSLRKGVVLERLDFLLFVLTISIMMFPYASVVSVVVSLATTLPLYRTASATATLIFIAKRCTF